MNVLGRKWWLAAAAVAVLIGVVVVVVSLGGGRSCGGYPTREQAQRSLAEHDATVREVEALGGPDGSVRVELSPACGADRVEVLVYHSSQEQRQRVLDRLGGPTLAGIPVEFRNW